MAAPAAKAITPFNDRMTIDQAQEWFANAQNRMLQWNLAARGNVPKTTLIELVRTVLPEIIGKSYYKKGEFDEWNAANTENEAKLSRLTENFTSTEQRLAYIMNVLMDRIKFIELPGNKKRAVTAEDKATLDSEGRRLRSRRDELQSLIYGADGPTFRMAERQDKRRKTLKNRQNSYVTIVKAYIESSDLFDDAQKMEANHFIDGLIPCFKKIKSAVTMSGKVRYGLINSNNDYRAAVSGFDAQFRGLPTSGSREVIEGLARLNANTRAAAAAVSRVPGMEDFNSLTNEILFNPESQNKDVIELLDIIRPEMMRRLEQRIENKVKLDSLETRLAALRNFPKEGTQAYSTLEQLITRLEQLRGKGGAGTGGAGAGSSGSSGGGRRCTRRSRRTTRRSRR